MTLAEVRHASRTKSHAQDIKFETNCPDRVFLPQSSGNQTFRPEIILAEKNVGHRNESCDGLLFPPERVQLRRIAEVRKTFLKKLLFPQQTPHVQISPTSRRFDSCIKTLAGRE